MSKSEHNPGGSVFSPSGCLTEDALFLCRVNRLPAREQHLAERHLLECELCRDAMEGISLLQNRGVLHEVQTQVQGLTRGGRLDFFSSRLFAVAAGITLLAGIASLIYLSRQEDSVTQMPVASVKEEAAPSSPVREKLQQDTTPAVESEMHTEPVAMADKHPAKNRNVRVKEEKQTPAPKSEEAGNKQPSVPEPVLAAATAPGEDAVKNADAGLEKDQPASSEKTEPQMETLAGAGYGAPAESSQNTLRQKSKKMASEAAMVAAEPRSSSGLDAAPSAGTLLGSGLQKMRKEKYSEALDDFTALLFAGQIPDSSVLLYTGICYYHLHNPGQAIKYLDRAAGSPGSSLYEESRWYKALSLLDKQDKAAAVLLDEIAKGNGAFKNKALKQLEDLRKQ